MDKGPFFDDNDWPIESRKKVIKSLPQNIYDCIQKLILLATKPEINEPPNFQQAIEQCIFQLPSDRKQMNPLMHFKVLNVIAIAYVFDLQTDEARKLFFSRLFLGREATALNDPAAHDNRIAALIRFSSLALQYPMPSFFDILAAWLLKDDNNLKCAQSIFSEISKGYLLRPSSWELAAFVEPLEQTSFEFSALAGIYFVIKENFAEPHRIPFVSILGEWFSKRPLDYLTFYSQYAHLAKDFALKRFPILMEYSLTNGATDVEHERLHVGVIALIMISKKTFAETPLDLTYLKSVNDDGIEINQRRIKDCIFTSKKYELIN